jgi:hypothetical protein
MQLTQDLPGNAQHPAVDHIRTLHPGDYVKIEGRFLERDQFELAAFPARQSLKNTTQPSPSLWPIPI